MQRPRTVPYPRSTWDECPVIGIAFWGRDFVDERGDGGPDAEAFEDAGLEVGKGAGFGVFEDGAGECVGGEGGVEFVLEAGVDSGVGEDEVKDAADGGGG